MRKISTLIISLLFCVNLAWSSSSAVIEVGHFDFSGGPLLDKVEGASPLPDGAVGELYCLENSEAEPVLLNKFRLNGSSLFGEAGYFLSEKLELSASSDESYLMLRIWNSTDKESATCYWESPLIPILNDNQQISFSTDEWTMHTVKSVNDRSSVTDVTEFALYSNYPNPFNAETNLRFDIAEQTQVTIKLYDMLGREAMQIVDGVYSPGSYTLSLNAGNLASGSYLMSMRSGTGFQQVRKMTLLK
jgi:hypothetical protein